MEEKEIELCNAEILMPPHSTMETRLFQVGVMSKKGDVYLNLFCAVNL